MSDRQHIDIYAGEDRTVTLYARDSSNLPMDLTGYTLAFNVGRRPNDPSNMSAVLSYAGTIVSASAGSFSVPIAGSDTGDLFPGNYTHQTNATSSTGKVSVVCVGKFILRPEATN